jgi:hypothetical protein
MRITASIIGSRISRLAASECFAPDCLRQPLNSNVERLLSEDLYGCSGSIATLRFLNLRPFDQLFMRWGQQSLSGCIVDFFTTVATTSCVCSRLDAGHYRPEFLGA